MRRIPVGGGATPNRGDKGANHRDRRAAARTSQDPPTHPQSGHRQQATGPSAAHDPTDDLRAPVPGDHDDHRRPGRDAPAALPTCPRSTGCARLAVGAVFFPRRLRLGGGRHWASASSSPSPASSSPPCCFRSRRHRPHRPGGASGPAGPGVCSPRARPGRGGGVRCLRGDPDQPAELRGDVRDARLRGQLALPLLRPVVLGALHRAAHRCSTSGASRSRSSSTWSSRSIGVICGCGTRPADDARWSARGIAPIGATVLAVSAGNGDFVYFSTIDARLAELLAGGARVLAVGATLPGRCGTALAAAGRAARCVAIVVLCVTTSKTTGWVTHGGLTLLSLPRSLIAAASPGPVPERAVDRTAPRARQDLLRRLPLPLARVPVARRRPGRSVGMGARRRAGGRDAGGRDHVVLPDRAPDPARGLRPRDRSPRRGTDRHRRRLHRGARRHVGDDRAGGVELRGFGGELDALPTTANADSPVGDVAGVSASVGSFSTPTTDSPSKTRRSRRSCRRRCRSRRRGTRPPPPRVAIVGDSTAIAPGSPCSVGATRPAPPSRRERRRLSCSIARAWGSCATPTVHPTTRRARAATGVPTVHVARSTVPDVAVIMAGPIDLADPSSPARRSSARSATRSTTSTSSRRCWRPPTSGSSRGIQVVWVTTPRIESGHDLPPHAPFPESDPDRMRGYNRMFRDVARQRPGVHVVDFRTYLRQQPGGELDWSQRPDGVHFANGVVEPIVAGWLAPAILSVVRPLPAAGDSCAHARHRLSSARRGQARGARRAETIGLPAVARRPPRTGRPACSCSTPGSAGRAAGSSACRCSSPSRAT